MVEMAESVETRWCSSSVVRNRKVVGPLDSAPRGGDVEDKPHRIVVVLRGHCANYEIENRIHRN